MSQDIVVFLLSAFTIVLILINGFLLWLVYFKSKKVDQILEQGKIKDFKTLFVKQKEINSELEGQIKQAFLKIKNLEDISKTTIQKTSVIRFNPFNDIGGNQSFIVALLDAENNGFIISSLFIKEGNSRVYAKEVKKGKSNYLLSKDEQEALNKAIKNG